MGVGMCARRRLCRDVFRGVRRGLYIHGAYVHGGVYRGMCVAGVCRGGVQPCWLLKQSVGLKQNFKGILKNPLLWRLYNS